MRYGYRLTHSTAGMLFVRNSLTGGAIVDPNFYPDPEDPNLYFGYQLKAVKCGASRRTLPLNFFAFRGKPIFHYISEWYSRPGMPGMLRY